jgi:hypothetical protein
MAEAISVDPKYEKVASVVSKNYGSIAAVGSWERIIGPSTAARAIATRHFNQPKKSSFAITVSARPAHN